MKLICNFHWVMDEGLKPEIVLQEQRCQPKKVSLLFHKACAYPSRGRKTSVKFSKQSMTLICNFHWVMDEGLKPEIVLQEQKCQPKKVEIQEFVGFASSQPAETLYN